MYEELSKCANFTWFLPKNYQTLEFLYLPEKLTKFPYTIFARKMPKYYIIIARKKFSGILTTEPCIEVTGSQLSTRSSWKLMRKAKSRKGSNFPLKRLCSQQPRDNFFQELAVHRTTQLNDCDQVDVRHHYFNTEYINDTDILIINK